MGAGVAIDWGRAVTETRDRRGPLTHVGDARAAGLLAGLMFSGVADRPVGEVPAWADAHLAFGHPASLLTEADMSECARGGRGGLPGGERGTPPG